MIEKLSHAKLVGILIIFGYLFLMAGNGLLSLTHPDEVFYAQTAKEMIAHKSYFTPIIFDQPQFEKPILTYWLLMLSAKIFGATSFAFRLWPALFGIIGVVTTYWLGFLLMGSKRIAFLSGFILLTSVIYLALSRAVLTDMIFSVFVTLSLACFAAGLTTLFFLCAGLAVLTKGLLGIVFPFGVAAIYLLAAGDKKVLKAKDIVLGLIIFCAIAIPWHVLMFKWYGHSFLDEYFRNVHVRRIFQAEHLKSDRWYFYLMTIIGGFFPWSLFVVPAGFFAYKKSRSEEPYRKSLVFLIIWILVVFGVMQFAKSKLSSYIFPLFPAAAILLAFYLHEIIESRYAFRSTKIILGIMSFASTMIGIGVFIAIKKFSTWVTYPVPFYILGTTYVLLGLAMANFLWRRQFDRVLLSMSFLTPVVIVVLIMGHAAAEPWVSCRNICDILQQKDNSNSVILCSKFFVRGVRFYTERPIAAIDINGGGFFSPHPIPFLNTDEKLLSFLNTQPVTYCVVKKGDTENLRRIAGRKFEITQIAAVGLEYLLRIDKRG